MIPIRDLLNRIRWDREFARADFRIGYFDRLEKKILSIPLREIVQSPGDNFSFQVMDDDGVFHRVPYHRIREVYRDGELIWKRNI